MSAQPITIYHSPDADDAFMFYGMVSGAVNVAGYTFAHELCDIETLNHRARRGELEVTAVSVHAFAYLADRFSIMEYGASMGGRDYGPKLITTKSITLSESSAPTIAIPGELTSAALALRLYLRQKRFNAELVSIPFDKVQDAVRSGEVDAGILIHEGQLTYEREGFRCLVDLGSWWWERHALPLPLGVNIVAKKLGLPAMRAAATALHQSIEYSLAHRTEALQYALSYGRGITFEEADRFVGMYVNNYTRQIGSDGRRSIELFLKEGAEAGFVPAVPVQFIE